MSSRVESLSTRLAENMEMMPIPGGDFVFRVEHRVREGRCPLFDHGPRPVILPPYSLGRYPVTNRQYAAFLQAGEYRPADDRNFLRHWVAGEPPVGKSDHPVVWVSPRDAEAYVDWAGMRLPTDEEWQWAAQGPEGGVWPWGDRFEPDRCHAAGQDTMAVDAFPAGASALGCLDMVGNVWEWTAPELDDGAHRWRLLRGGSYFLAQGSIWYTEGGPQPTNRHLRFLLIGEGLNRCATVGFRCTAEQTERA
jgi:formylglycine-generating enzyme required for sulfatase activity